MRNIFFAFVILLLFQSLVLAVPQYINYQGMLRDASGNVQTGPFSMVFKIYSALTGGTAVYDSGTTSVSVSNGLYNVQLGAIDSTVFTGSDRYLEITVGSDTLSPRLKINSVAYAITSANADYATLSGTASSAAIASYATLSGTASSAAVADNAVTTAKIQDSAVTAAKIANSTITGGKLASDIAISTTGNIAGNNYTINGTFNITTGTNKSVGTSQIDFGGFFADIANSSVTSNSIIILNVGSAASTAGSNANGGIRISSITSGSAFRVATMNGNAASANIPFSYLIIN